MVHGPWPSIRECPTAGDATGGDGQTMTTLSDAEPAEVSDEVADTSADGKSAAAPYAGLVTLRAGAGPMATAAVPPEQYVDEEIAPVPGSFVETYRRDLLADLTDSVGDPHLAKSVLQAANETLDEQLRHAQRRSERLNAAHRLVRGLPEVVSAGQGSIGPTRP